MTAVSSTSKSARVLRSLDKRIDPSAHLASSPAFAAIQEIPVKYTVLSLASFRQSFRKQFAQEIVIGRFFETKLAHVIEVDPEFLYPIRSVSSISLTGKRIARRTWKSFGKVLNWRALLLLPDLFVFLLVGCSLETLPW